MNYIWDTEGTAYVFIKVNDYPDQGVSLDSLKPIVEEIRKASTSMIITADLKDVNILRVDRLLSIAGLIREVLEYTKDDRLLEKIEIKNAGFIFRSICRALPIRDLITFL